MDCFICDKHRSGDDSFTVADGDLMTATHLLPPDLTDVYLGWLIVEPRRHVTALGDLTDSEAAEMGRMLSRVAGAMQQALDVEHVYLRLAGDAVPHLHIHLVPRYRGTPREFWGDAVTDWPNAPRGGADEIRSITQRLARALSG